MIGPDHPDLQPLGEPSTERFIGTKDLTRWSRVGQRLAGLAVRASRYLSAHSILVGSALIGLVLVCALTVASAEIYDNVKDADDLATLGVPALTLAISLRTPTNVAVAQFLTNLGGPVGLTIILIIVVAVMTICWRSRTPLVLMVIGMGGSLLMTTIGKDLVGRARPPQSAAVPPYEVSPSFPSGHALNNTVAACLVAYLLLLHLTSMLLRILTVVLAVAWFVTIGLTRVFLGYHWLTDVMVGWTLGLAWTLLIITSHRLFLTVRDARRRPGLDPAHPTAPGEIVA